MGRPKKDIKITDQLTVGLMAAEAEALKAVSTLYCVTPSQIGRRAILALLISEGAIENPIDGLRRQRAAVSNPEAA